MRAVAEVSAKKSLYEGSPAQSGSLADWGLPEVPKIKEGVTLYTKDIFRLKEEIIASASNAATALDVDGAFQAASPSNAQKIQNVSLMATNVSRAATDDSGWDDAGSGLDFQSSLDSAQIDGISHLSHGESNRFSHCNGKDPCGDSWRVFDHRTEGRLHINKRDLDLYKKENEKYSAYGDTEGDGTLEGAVYGLFAAEDILHPDSIVAADGTVRNTGTVYKRNDLVAVATTNENGNADFLAFTEQPGRVYNYENGTIEKRSDIDWDGPKNLYQDAGFRAEIDHYTGDTGMVRSYQNNELLNGNCWIGRPLILGKYYVKELSRSEGYELSVNGITQEDTNLGTGYETPESVASAHGTAVLSMPELSAAMEGDDGGGNGYNQLPFFVTSLGTVDPALWTDGYDLVVSGFPEGTSFYRVDSGEEEVTGPHVTGTEEVTVKDENGETVWVRAESDSSNIKYRPIYGESGELVSQEPMSREEAQILKAEQIPEMKAMEVSQIDFDLTDLFYQEPILDHDLSIEQSQAFLFIKAKVEETLQKNGYDIPITAEGRCSTLTQPVYSRGVKKGDPDFYGQTTTAGSPAVKTVYGAAIVKLEIRNPSEAATMMEMITTILSWYNDHPQWSFGGIDQIEKIEDGYTVTLYAAVSNRHNRRFFTAREDSGKLVVDKVYAVHENPHDLRWVYQEYSETGDETFEVEKQYSLGSGGSRRNYIDAVLKPAMLVNEDGNLQEIFHRVMVYHKKGEEIIDYLDGDSAHGYRVPLTETRDKIEITTELEQVETDVPLEASYDKQTGTYRIHVEASGTNHYGEDFTDADGSLKLSFLAVTNQKKVTLTEPDIISLGTANVFGYKAGDSIGYVQYLMRFGNGSVSVSVSDGMGADDTYIVTKRLVYRGQNKVSEDGDSSMIPIQVLERPIKQKVKVVKDIQTAPDGTYHNNSYEIHGDLFQAGLRAIPNFRFRIYLKSNLERLYRNEAGEVFWQDKDGKPVNIEEYRGDFPELVQKIYTGDSNGTGRILESMAVTVEDGAGGQRTVNRYNYEKFFDAVGVADMDKWKNKGGVLNSSFKPFAASLLTGIANEINTSMEAKENVKRSDAVRQFAVDWYLDEEAGKLLQDAEDDEFQAKEQIRYSDELYDKALHSAILRAEEYLKPFFQYDLNTIYAIAWDSEANGGIDRDKTTLAANSLFYENGSPKYSYGISEYLPYGDYVLVEQQPWNPDWEDFANKHYSIDTPKEISLPAAYEEGQNGAEEIPEKGSEFYRYHAVDTPDTLAAKYLIRFNEEMAANHTDDVRSYVIKAHSHDGDFEVYKYGLDVDQTGGHYEPYGNPEVAKYYHYDSTSEHAGIADGVLFTGGASDTANSSGMYWKDRVKTMSGVRTAFDGKYAPMLVPWSMTEPDDEASGSIQNPDGTSSYEGYAYRKLRNTFYGVKLRIEKLDAETGEQILHDDAVFALYAAERDDAKNGDGAVRRYAADTMISGSREFLEAMGARNITPFARSRNSKTGPGKSYYGVIPAGAPVCVETEGILLADPTGIRTGTFEAHSTVRDGSMKKEYERGTEEALQTVGYLETPRPVGAGVYVLAELKPPAGYVRSKPVPVEVYSDEVSYYLNGGADKTNAVLFAYPQLLDESGKPIEDPNGNKPEDLGETARIYVNDAATCLEVSKRKTEDAMRKMKVSGRVEGTITELSGRYGLENLELAYNSSGKYLNYGWLKGTLEFLESRKAAGEMVEVVYNEHQVFSGYGYVTRKLDTAEDQNPYVPGAALALYDAIEVRLTGDTQDYALEGVNVERDRNGNVCSIVVKEGYGGSKLEFVQKNDGIWGVERIYRKDTPVLFYDLGGLAITREEPDGRLMGYDRDGREMEITSDTRSIYALRSGNPIFEISGSKFDELVYDKGARAFTSLPQELTIYHLDEALCRDAMVDGYTGVAYVENEGKRFVWPVNIAKDSKGNVIAREKILTGSPAEVNTGKADAYTAGTLDGKRLEKRMEPVLDLHGLVRYYLKSSRNYQKGEAVYDRDGDYVRYRYDDLLEDYNRAAYMIKEHEELFETGDPKNPGDNHKLWNRKGENWLIPNVWISGERAPNDPSDKEMTDGQADMLRRVYPGTYIMEELAPPDGYVRSLPVAVKIGETAAIQKVFMNNEKTKVEILKVDAAETWKIPAVDCDREHTGKDVWEEGKGSYTFDYVEGAELALFKAERVYTSDFEKYPKGYYLRKLEQTPAVWMTQDAVDNHPVEVTGRWITEKGPKYFEGIPCGDYILEELSAPLGYLKSSTEVTVEETEELQSFILKNDHTKLEVYKFQVDSFCKEEPLDNQHRAKLALYPAQMNPDGGVRMENGEPLYYQDNPVDVWRTDDLSDYIPFMTSEYQRLFSEYGDRFEQFSWYVDSGIERSARRLENRNSDGGETVTQLWTVDDGNQVRITACRSGGPSDMDHNGYPAVCYEYQFNYVNYSGTDENFSSVVSYDTQPGRHRVDRIPEGFYVLVEEEAPDGYEKAGPKLIQAAGTVSLQRYGLENRRREIYVDKVNEKGMQVTGASLALYRPDEMGDFTEAEAFLVDRWISGTEGTYTADDRADGTIPDGYRPGDFRLHRLPAVREGIYYLAEEQPPDYYKPMEPMKIVIGSEAQVVVKAVNRMAMGQLIIEKQDATWSGKTLAGAVFEVENTSTGQCITMVTGENGQAVSPLLDIGSVGSGGVVNPYKYRVREIQPPEGYRLNFTEREMYFDGKDSDMEILTYFMEYPNEETELEISKTDFGTGHFVEGARLAIYPARLEDGSFQPAGEAVDEWISDGGVRRIVGRLCAGRTYILMETATPDGYGTAKPLVFSVSSDGRKLHVISQGLQQIQLIFEERGDSIKEAVIAGRAGISVDYRMEENGGIQTRYERTTFSDGSSVLTEKETYRTGEEGNGPAGLYQRRLEKTEMILSSLKDERVMISHWNVEEGEESHRIDNKKELESGKLIFSPGSEFILEERCHYSDGEILTTSRTSFGIKEDGSVNRLTMENRMTEAHFRKVDITDGREVPGVCLELRSEDGVLVERWLTGEKEHVICGKLIPGQTYILKEIQPADGFAYAEEIHFTMNGEGCIETIRMDDRPTHIVISKTDIATGEELPGAHLTLLDGDGRIVESWISGNTPHEIKGQLIAGKQYTLHEELPPGGYAWSEDVNFTVSLDGTIDRVVMEDKPTKVVIRKTDLTTGEELPGAQMELRDQTGKTVEKWISGTVPHEITAQLAAGEQYTLYETGAPDGYAYAEEITFTVSEHGFIDRITMEDKPTTVEVEKRNEDGQILLGGAMLQILDTDDKVLEEWQTKEGEAHCITGILRAGGSYILREIQPPPGYQVAEDMKFTVSPDGSVDKIIMIDQEVKPGREPEPERETPPDIQIGKTDKDTGEPLPGAEFTVFDEHGRVYLTVKTGRNGKAVFARPEPGVYTYRETKAPDGYVKKEETYSFTVTESGKVKGTLFVYNERQPAVARELGTITASYSAGPLGKGAVYLDEDGKIRIRIPEAGDERRPAAELIMAILSGILLVWFCKKRREM